MSNWVKDTKITCFLFEKYCACLKHLDLPTNQIASKEAIKRGFKRCALKCHPGIFQGFFNQNFSLFCSCRQGWQRRSFSYFTELRVLFGTLEGRGYNLVCSISTTTSTSYLRTLCGDSRGRWFRQFWLLSQKQSTAWRRGGIFSKVELLDVFQIVVFRMNMSLQMLNQLKVPQQTLFLLRTRRFIHLVKMTMIPRTRLLP